MESFEFPSLFRGIAKTARILVLCLALTWILARIPFAVRFAADCLRSPLFVFALSNAIIAALIAQSGRGGTQSDDSVSSPLAEEAEYHDDDKHIAGDTCTDSDSVVVAADNSDCDSDTLKDGNETQRGELRRSEETEIAPENLYPQDELSSEEFQRLIEEFIAKQLRFLREESLAIFVHPPETINDHYGAKSLNNYTHYSC